MYVKAIFKGAACVAGLFILLVIISYMYITAPTPHETQYTKWPAAKVEQQERPFFEVDRSVEAQRERLALIQKFGDAGILYKIEWSAVVPNVWVTPDFMLLNVDEKKIVCQLIYAYYAVEQKDFGTSEADFVLLRSSLDDHDVGTYNPFLGLKIRGE